MSRFTDYADILATIPFHLGYFWAADKFCKKYMETSGKKELMFVVFSFCGSLLLNGLQEWYGLPRILYLIFDHLLFAGLVFVLFQAEWEKKILISFMLMMIMTLVGNFFEAFFNCLALFFRHTVEKNPNLILNVWESGLIDCASLCLVIVAVHQISKRLTSFFCGKPGKWYAVLAVPLFMIIAVFDVASWGAGYGVMVRSGGNMGLYYDQIFSHAEFLILAALSMAAAGFYVFGMERIYLEQKKSGQYRAQISTYHMLEEQYNRSERLRHDLKNHVLALSGLWEEKEWEKLGRYLKKMENSAELGTCEEATGNRVVDVLLYQKRKSAEEKQITWESNVQIPKACGISEFDLCVLFGNILDNAVEACGKSAGRERGEKSFVHVRAGAVKKCFLLEAANSADGADRSKSGHVESQNRLGHGIGLLNVSDVVHRYNGVMNVEMHDGIFTISVLIPLEDAAHDIERVV